MTRSRCCLALSCLALSCLVTACAPPKAAEVVVTPSSAPLRNKQPADPGNGTPAMPPVARESGMQLPPLEKLPDRRDMTPTTAPPAGGSVIATPPTPPQKPVNE